MNTEKLDIKKILMVEDDPRDVELTLAALEEHHLANQVAVVRDGAEALDYLYSRGKFKARAEGLPVLVLLDLKLPKVSGLEVLKIIKADEHLKIIPVVVLTSSRETPDVAECYRHGVNAYVVKPVDFAEFVKAVKQLGIFWAAINEPPPIAWKEETGVQSGKTIFAGKEEVKK
jgi:CheY-like chemotaxis protein